jgi:hypothetical protein
MEYYRLTIPIPKQPWKWLRFRIVTVLLLVAIVAISLAWYRDHKRLSRELYVIQNPVGAWSVEQATGPPNTNGPGDFSTAWASATQDDQKEWLVLEFAESVVPTAILIHETYNPGAVMKVTHYPRWGREKVLWEGSAPNFSSVGTGATRLPVSAAIRTGRLKVYIDSPAVPGWNEIDAVGLQCADGSVIWADYAEASSSYAQRANGPAPGATFLSTF